jgi:hypothetical protein
MVLPLSRLQHALVITTHGSRLYPTPIFQSLVRADILDTAPLKTLPFIATIYSCQTAGFHPALPAESDQVSPRGICSCLIPER